MPVYVTALLTLFAAAGAELEQAQRLYDKARYEEARKLLGPPCRGESEAVKCERLRGLVEVALGREDEARAAFERMVALGSDVTLAAVAPKVQALFDAAARNVQEARNLALAPVHADPVWTLRLPDGAPAGLVEVMVHVSPAGHTRFQAVELRREGDLWQATLGVGETEAGPARYFMQLRLASGAELFIGSEASPREVVVYAPPEAPLAQSPFDLPGLPVPEAAPAQGMPAWAVWTAAGVAALVIAGVVTWVALSGEPEPGAIRVTIRFEDDP